MFEAFFSAFGAAIDDVRSKLIDEAWFGRRRPDRAADTAREVGDDAPDERSLLDRLFEDHPELFTTEPEQPGHAPEHGIDR
ncbi:hypothetical protein [Sphingomonas sp.]|uniref:hypothetical protein n=1 Tax=Sphingomonas sp. TaxID=28214 RepID=UPI001B04D567|nr:hypothetical protein [Sphingomonas sp.]MBO9712633.1 hypothetical protein [Sphingomonas sp.]